MGTYVRELTDADRDYIDRRRAQALWYALGRTDEASQAGEDKARYLRGRRVDCWEFASMAADEAEAFRSERVSSLAGIMEQWDRFVASRELMGN